MESTGECQKDKGRRGKGRGEEGNGKKEKETRVRREMGVCGWGCGVWRERGGRVTFE